jgi:16S rRNA (guanine527-N7)-methyltransferase
VPLLPFVVTLPFEFQTKIACMDERRIAELLQPFLEAGPAAPGALSSAQLKLISTYIDLLIRWNERVNLTAIRTPEEIVARHFGESLFAARHLLPVSPPDMQAQAPQAGEAPLLVDLGSGAGFPGLPLKIWSPQTRVTLLESNHKKVAFLRETIRALILTNIDVFPGRAENFPARASILTLRAVEHFDDILPVAISLLAPAATLALLVSSPQVSRARSLASDLRWSTPIPIPQSTSRVLLKGELVEPDR